MVMMFTLALCAATRLYADVALAPLFTDNMVLQRGMAVPVWGMATPGEEISIAFKGQKQSVKADSAGKWMVRLAPMKASSEGCNLYNMAGLPASPFRTDEWPSLTDDIK
jgi:sialate O-acetylesterase